jgi:serine protease AprX
MTNESFYPIKVVFKSEGDDRPRKPMRVEKLEPLGPVTPELRRRLALEVEGVRSHFAESFSRWPTLPVVAKITLKAEAIAKYRRPHLLFNNDTCPIVGGGSPTVLYASATPRGLDELARRIRNGSSGDTEAHISTIASISPYTASDALRGKDATDPILRKSSRPLKLRVFRHRSSSADRAIETSLLDYFRELKVGDVEVLEYAPTMTIYALHSVPPAAIASIASFVGTQNLTAFPNYRVVRTASRAVANVSATNFPPPDPAKEYGLVGIIDTGTDHTNRHLEAWVAGRHSHHPASQQDHDHGSFVAGLIVHPQLLNHGDKRFPNASCRVVDVVAVDKSGITDEYDLRTIIEDSLRRFPAVKVWNMSLAMEGERCQDEEFSEFGAFIDAKSRQHGVLFVLPAGNYDGTPSRTWPAQPGLGETDRIGPPADSVCSLVVGSMAHRDSTSTLAREGEPSPFTRRGPASAYLMKPELSGWGGNCDDNANCLQVGVMSIDGHGHIAESIGTSFACPQIASVAGHIYRELQIDGQNPTPSLVKALIMHAAFMACGVPDPELVKYVGLGCPPDPATILNCTKSSATCIFQIPVRTSPLFMRRPFPMPKCLVDPDKKGLKAEVFMTLHYDTPLDKRFAAEYCRHNVTASLGTVRPGVNEDGKATEAHTKEIGTVPRDLEKGWEAELVKSGFKWSPLKLYHHRFRNGPVDFDWQLQLKLEQRVEFRDEATQNVNLIVTIRDPLGAKPVYDEMVREMNRIGWNATDLRLHSRQRAR